MAWNKRESTSGGASTGRDGIKRGGRGGSPRGKNNPDTEKDYDKRGAKAGHADLEPVETADCPTCNGTGKVTADRSEADEDGGFAGTQEVDCTACDGTGLITRRRR
ncbi:MULTISPECIES: hypothetical protein [unclassified Frankia]